MSLSGVTTFGQWAQDIVKKAMVKCQRLAIGDDPAPEEMDHGLEVLDMVQQSLQDEKTFLWARERTTQATVASDYDYSLAADTLDVLPLETSISVGGVYRKLKYVTLEKFWELHGADTNEAAPAYYAVDRSRAAANGDHVFSGLLTLLVHPIPDDAYTISYTRVRRLQTLELAINDVDAPARWSLTLVKLLAAELAEDYGLSLQEQAKLAGRGMDAKRVSIRGDGQRVPLRFFPRMRY